MIIKELTSDCADWSRVAAFAKECSWQSTGAYLSELMTENKFCEFERVFCACEQNTITGFCAITKENCIENDTHAPWLDFLFVEEPYRGRGISRQLINTALSYARTLNFKALYLCTVTHEKMYEKYGFHPLYTSTINQNTTGTVMALAL